MVAEAILSVWKQSNLLQDTCPIIWGGIDCVVLHCLPKGVKP